VLETTRITAYMMPGIGTYSFDTFTGGTSSKAGKWMLPFCDHAHYIHECDSSLGWMGSQSHNIWKLEAITARIKETPAAVLTFLI
jgi:hypothetical protein